MGKCDCDVREVAAVAVLAGTHFEAPAFFLMAQNIIISQWINVSKPICPLPVPPIIFFLPSYSKDFIHRPGIAFEA